MYVHSAHIMRAYRSFGHSFYGPGPSHSHFDSHFVSDTAFGWHFQRYNAAHYPLSNEKMLESGPLFGILTQLMAIWFTIHSIWPSITLFWLLFKLITTFGQHFVSILPFIMANWFTIQPNSPSIQLILGRVFHFLQSFSSLFSRSIGGGSLFWPF